MSLDEGVLSYSKVKGKAFEGVLKAHKVSFGVPERRIAKLKALTDCVRSKLDKAHRTLRATTYSVYVEVVMQEQRRGPQGEI